MTAGGRNRLYCGAMGSGKTYTMLAHISDQRKRRTGFKFLALDPNEEMPGPTAKGLPPPVIVRTPRDAFKALSGGRADLVVVRPRIGERVRHLERLESLAHVAVMARPVVLVVPEAQLALPKQHVDLERNAPHVHAMLHQVRHRKVNGALWLDTQHLRDLSEEAINSCEWRYLFATGSKGDLARIREMGGSHGRELEAAVREAGRRAAVQKQPGWHVRTNILHNSPPFELVRA